MNLIRVSKKTMKKGVLKSAFATDKRTISINGENFIICPGEVTFHKNGNLKSFYAVDVPVFDVKRRKVHVFTNANYTRFEIVYSNVRIKGYLVKAENTYCYTVSER